MAKSRIDTVIEDVEKSSWDEYLSSEEYWEVVSHFPRWAELIEVSGDKWVEPVPLNNPVEVSRHMAEHWTSARYIHQWLTGYLETDPDMLYSCEANVDNRKNFAIFPCTGGWIMYYEGVVYCSTNKTLQLSSLGIDHVIITDGRTYRSHQSIINKYDENGWWDNDANTSCGEFVGVVSNIVVHDNNYVDYLYEGYINEGCKYYPVIVKKLLKIPDLEDRGYDSANPLIAPSDLQYIFTDKFGRSPKHLYLSVNFNSYNDFQPTNWDDSPEEVDGVPVEEFIERFDRMDKKLFIKSMKTVDWDGLVSEGRLEQYHVYESLFMMITKKGMNYNIIQRLLSKFQDWNTMYSMVGNLEVDRLSLINKTSPDRVVIALNTLPDDIDLSSMTTNEIIDIFDKYVLENSTDVIEREMMRMGVPDHRVQEYKKWLEQTKKPTYTTIPGPSDKISYGFYNLRRLDDYDAMGPLLGIMTDCCQHPWGAGRTCAYHGYSNPDGAFVVIEKKGKVVAQSWMWRDGDTVCFDNIEVLGSIRDKPVIELYTEYAEDMVGRFGIRRVVVGGGYDDAGVADAYPLVPKGEIALPPKGLYSDANTQYLIASV